MIACSGGSGSKPAAGPVLSNQASAPADGDADGEIEAEIIVGRTGIPENLLSRQMAIEQARAAGILGPARGTPQPQPTGGPLDKAAIRREIRTRLMMIQLCYEQRLVAVPQLQGTTRVAIEIGADGSVTSSTGSGFDREVDRCVASAVESLKFPAPKSGGTKRVTYPFTFRPSPANGAASAP